MRCGRNGGRPLRPSARSRASSSDYMTSASMYLEEAVARIRPPDADPMARAAERHATLTKPPGSLGKLEDLSIQLAGIMRTEWPRIGDAIIPATIAGAGSMSSTWRATQYRGASAPGSTNVLCE